MEDVRDHLLNINMTQQQQSAMQNQLLTKLYKLETMQAAQGESLANLRKEVAELVNKSKSPDRARSYPKKRDKSSRINIKFTAQQPQKHDEDFPAAGADINTEADDSDADDYYSPLSSRTRVFRSTRDSKNRKRISYHIRDNIECPDQVRRNIGKRPDRDLHLTPHGVYNSKWRLYGLVTLLMSEKTKETVNPKSDLVREQVDDLKLIAKGICSHMLCALAKRKKRSLVKALEFHWSQIPDDIQDKYAVLFEKKAYKRLNLDVGRCEEMWGARYTLSLIWNKRRRQKHTNQFEQEIREHLDNCDESCDTSDLFNYPPAVVNNQQAAAQNIEVTMSLGNTESSQLTASSIVASESTSRPNLTTSVDADQSYYTQYADAGYKDASFGYTQSIFRNILPMVIAAPDDSDNESDSLH